MRTHQQLGKHLTIAFDANDLVLQIVCGVFGECEDEESGNVRAGGERNEGVAIAPNLNAATLDIKTNRPAR